MKSNDFIQLRREFERQVIIHKLAPSTALRYRRIIGAYLRFCKSELSKVSLEQKASLYLHSLRDSRSRSRQAFFTLKFFFEKVLKLKFKLELESIAKNNKSWLHKINLLLLKVIRRE